jgi:hypothetical protein
VRNVIIAQKWFVVELLSAETRCDHGPEEPIVKSVTV